MPRKTRRERIPGIARAGRPPDHRVLRDVGVVQRVRFRWGRFLLRGRKEGGDGRPYWPLCVRAKGRGSVTEYRGKEVGGRVALVWGEGAEAKVPIGGEIGEEASKA